MLEHELTPECRSVLQQSAELAGLGVFVVDPRTKRCVYCSERLARMHGLPAATCMTLIGTQAQLERIHEDDRERYRAALARVLAAGGRYQVDYRMHDAAGTLLDVREMAEQVVGRSGAPCLVGCVQDVSQARRIERRVAELQAAKQAAEAAGQAATASNNRFVAAAESLMDGLAIFDAEDRLVYHNRRYLQHAPRLFGGAIEIGKRFSEIVEAAVAAGAVYHPEMGEDFVERRLAGHRAPWHEQEFRIADGRWVRVRESAIEGGGRVILTSDITAQRAATSALEEREHRLRTIADGVPVPIIISRLSQPEILFVNELAAETFGFRVGPQAAAVRAAYVDTQDGRRLLERVQEGGRVDGFEVQLRRADRSTMWALLSARAIAVAGEPALLVTATDISERRASEAELEEREERFRAVAEGVPLAVTIVRNEPAEILFANARASESFGLRAGDGAAAVGAVYVDPADRRALVDQLGRIGRIDGFEARLRRADGSTIWALLSAREITFHGAPAMLTAVTEISDLKVMEQALRDSEARLAAFMENAPVGMYLKDRKGRYTLANPEMSEVFARPAQEMLGLTAADTLAGHDLDGVLRHDREVLESGRVVVVEEHTPALGAYSWSLVIRFPVRGDDGEITHIGGFHVDITERKRIEAELDRQSALLHQNEKLSALGSLLAGVAHELNNPLSLVVGYAGLLEEMAPDDATRERAVKVRIAADRCARIVRTFLAMARNKPRAPVPVQLNEVAEAALEIVAYGLRTADIQVERCLAPDLAPVHGDADQLHQVLANLLVNAQQALQTVPPPRRLRITSGEDGEAVWVAIADNGPGIPATIASRIFEPFFTTKPQGVGTGVGLAVSHGIVAAHGGQILVESEPGGGSTFTVRLQRSRTDRPEQAAVDPPGSHRRARILVVDDEPEIADLLTDILEGDGHETASASSGREALEWLRGREVDLIISDLRMPDMDGPALYRALAERRPELLTRLVFITGDTLAADITGFLSETGAKVIEKPLDPPEVSRKVQALLADDEELSISPLR